MQAIFLDIETTGLDVLSHRILEIAFKIVDVVSGAEKLTYQTMIKQPQEVWERRDLSSLEINGLTWEQIQQGRQEEEVRAEIIQIFTSFAVKRGKTIYICQNPAFDRTFFTQLIPVSIQEKSQWPYHWLDFASMYWALQVKDYRDNHLPFPSELSLSKNAIAAHYQLPLEPAPHSALNGVNHLLLCYRTVVGFEEPLF